MTNRTNDRMISRIRDALTWRRLIVFSGALGVLASLVVPGILGCRPAPPGPNIIVLLVDAMRADHLGCYGYEEDTTPRIDELAASSVLFERAYAQAPLTPTSVASILTAYYPDTHRLLGDKDVIYGKWATDKLLTHTIREAGWRTAGLSANPLVCEEWGFDKGFDYFFWKKNEDAAGLNELLKSWIQKRLAASERFFAYVHYMEPHDPYHPSSIPSILVAGKRVTGDIDPINVAIRRGREVRTSQALIDAYITLYDGEIMDADREIGALLDWLGEQRLLENTVIAVLADHGEAFREHGWFKHSSTVYEEMVRIPLIIYIPEALRSNLAGAGGGATGRAAGGAGVSGVTPGGLSGLRIAEPVEGIDMMPTVMAACGIQMPEGRHGRNLLAPAANIAETPGSTADGAIPPGYDANGAETPGPAADPWLGAGPLAYIMTWNGWDPAERMRIDMRTAVDGNWKYIITPHYDREELYRLDIDPMETEDLSAAHPEVLERMRALLAGTVPVVPVDGGEIEGVSERITEQMKSMGYIE